MAVNSALLDFYIRLLQSSNETTGRDAGGETGGTGSCRGRIGRRPI
jgi:hypothetical protein